MLHRPSRYLWILVFLFFSSTSVVVCAANFGVGPMQIELGLASKTGLIKVSNNDTNPLQLQVRLFSWASSATGESVYEESEDLVFFPQLLNIQPNDNHLIRVGIKTPSIEKEKSYILFIEEIPSSLKKSSQDMQSADKPSQGMQIAVAVRFGIPVFVRPQKVQAKAEISGVSLDQGVLSLTVKNTGNVHLAIPQIQFSAQDKFSKNIPGRTLLAESERKYQLAIPEAVCNSMDELNILVKTTADKLEPASVFKINKASCQ